MQVGQLVTVHGCNDQVVLAFFIEFKNKITALAIVEQVIDSVALFVFDPDDIAELRSRVEREVELNIKMVGKLSRFLSENIVRCALVNGLLTSMKLKSSRRCCQQRHKAEKQEYSAE